MYQEKGNIVKEFDIQVNGQKVHVRISDSAFAGKSQEEMEADRRRAREIAWNIALRHEARLRAEQGAG